ncbi:MAG: protein kinase [Polyangiales bacterium]
MERAPPLSPGERCGAFEVVRALKRGGMGALYEARDRATGELVAVKTLHAAGAATAARFERECRVAERLRHPNIVAGRGHGRTPDGTPWFAMDLLSGEDLEARLARGSLPVADSLSVARQVCRALSYAHQQGVIHRDIKPANLFLADGSTDHVYVLDFGVARVADAPPLTGTEVPVGTASYMSPEQARGDRGVDPRTDLWSLGVVLYECLAGRRPFVAETLVGVFFQILEATPPRLDECARGVPPALADIVQQALEKRPERRVPSAAAMLAALDASALSAPPAAVPPSLRAGGAEAGTGDHLAERRRASVALVHEVRDLVRVDASARSLGARVERLTGDRVVALFGLDRWSGDEPRRALRFAREVLPVAGGVSVATGRVVRGALRVLGAAIDDAARRVVPGAVSLDAATAEVAREAPDASPPTFDTPFVGREVELGLLLRSAERAWEEACPTGVAVCGPAGIGKSRLRHEAMGRLRARVPGATLLACRCDFARQATPFAALRDALAPLLDPSVDAWFERSAETGDATAALDHVRGALGALLDALAARGPAVWAFDDAQWIDGASRAAIRWLRETFPDHPFAVWAFGRAETGDLRALVGDAAPLALGALDARESSQLLCAIGGAAPEGMIERAGGHPLFLEELGQLLARRSAGGSAEDLPLPLSVEGTYLAQLDQMLPAEREFLKRAAVFGRTFWVEGVEALGGDAAAAARLRGARWVVPHVRSRIADAREMRFRVGVLQEVAEQLLPEATLTRLHGDAARWLDGRRGATPEELARHWDVAGERAPAAAAYARAAEDAARVADSAAACAHTARALSLTDDPALRWRALAARDDALQLTDQLGLIREGLDALDALAPALGARAQAEAAWRRCYFARVTYDAARALAEGGRALALADGLGDARWGAAVHIDLAMVRATGAALPEAERHAELARALAARAGGAWLSARAEATSAYVRSEAGGVAEGLALYERAAEGFAAVGDRRREALMRSNAGWALLRLGRLDAAEAQMGAAIEASRRVGNQVTVAACTHNLGVLRRMRGDWDGAGRLQHEAESVAARRHNGRLVAAARVERVYVALARGDDGEAVDALARAAVAAAEAARSAVALASAQAAALRAWADGETRAAALDAARVRAEALVDPEALAEHRVAIWEGSGRAPGALAAARAAVAALLAGAEGEERAARADALARRYLIDREVMGG